MILYDKNPNISSSKGPNSLSTFPRAWGNHRVPWYRTKIPRKGGLIVRCSWCLTVSQCGKHTWKCRVNHNTLAMCKVGINCLVRCFSNDHMKGRTWLPSSGNNPTVNLVTFYLTLQENILRIGIFHSKETRKRTSVTSTAEGSKLSISLWKRLK